MTETEPLKVARAFIACINAHDVDGLAALMSVDHRFVDATGAVHRGRDAMTEGWHEYLASFPDYRIEIDDALSAGSTVALFGWAIGTHGASGRSFRIPAAWRVTLEEDAVAEWRVYADVEPMLQSMGAGRQP